MPAEQFHHPLTNKAKYKHHGEGNNPHQIPSNKNQTCFARTRQAQVATMTMISTGRTGFRSSATQLATELSSSLPSSNTGRQGRQSAHLTRHRTTRVSSEPGRGLHRQRRGEGTPHRVQEVTHTTRQVCTGWERGTGSVALRNERQVWSLVW